MSNHYAWATLTGKVFVSQDELYEKLSELHPDRCKWDSENADWIDDTSAAEEREAFEQVAREKISEAYGRTDEPMKLEDVDIDIGTYR